VNSRQRRYVEGAKVRKQEWELGCAQKKGGECGAIGVLLLIVVVILIIIAIR